MNVVEEGLLSGVLATVGMDVWALIVRYGLRLPTTNWALFGRWLAHMPLGRFNHDAIAAARPIAGERLIGWIGHYVTGAVYGVLYLGIVLVGLGQAPSLPSALVFGLATLAAPWLIMQPAMGVGYFAARAPRPNVARLVSTSMHVVYALALYGATELTLS